MKIVRTYLDGGYRVVIEAQKGPKWTHLIHTAPEGVKVTKVRNSTYRNKPVFLDGKPYPVKRAIQIYRKAGRGRGITKSAKQLMRSV